MTTSTQAHDKIRVGLEQLIEHREGKRKLKTRIVTVPQIDIRLLRKRLDLSQQEFAERYQIPLTTLQNWEQGRREPDQVAQVYLRAIDKDPAMVGELIASA